MNTGGYVLTGGNSTRMGRDKALLEAGGVTLVESVAQRVLRATGNVTLAGHPERYSQLGFRGLADLRDGRGPLAALEAALLDSPYEWNLIVACDMASASEDLLVALCQQALALSEDADCLVPRDGAGRLQPLCAVYRKRCATAFREALDAGRLKVTDAVSALHLRLWNTESAESFQNINTPEDWTRYLNGKLSNGHASHHTQG